VTLTGLTGNGDLTVSVKAGTSTDLAGNADAGAGPTAKVVVDNVSPVVSIGGPSVGKTSRGPVSFTVSASDPNGHLSTPFTLSAGNVVLDVGGSTLAGDIFFSRLSPTSYRVTVNNVHGGSGMLQLKVLTGAATDLAANPSAEVESVPVQVVGVKRLVVGFYHAPLRLLPGSAALYQVAYRNAGTQLDTGVEIVVKLPEHASFNAAGSTAGWTSIGGRRYKLVIGTVNAGGHGIVKFAVKYDRALPSTVSFTAGITDDVLGDDKMFATKTTKAKVGSSRFR
jgi:hypothetical protein